MSQSESTAPEVEGTPADVVDQLTNLFASEDSDTADGEAAPAEGTPDSEATGSEPDAEETPESQDDEEDGEETPAGRPATVKVKVDGKDVEITLDEALKGYSRTADYTRKTQALAEERKKFEAEAAEIRGARQRYDAGLKQIEDALKEIAGPAEPDWDALRASGQYKPEEINAAWIQYQRNKEQLAQVRAERARVAQQEQAEQQQALRKQIIAERDKLFEALPDLKDEVKGKALRSEMAEFAESRGITLDELNNTNDHRAILLLHDAMQYHKLLAQKQAASKKVDEALQRTAQPGTGNKGKAPKKTDLQRAEARFADSGSDDDAVELLLMRGAGRK